MFNILETIIPVTAYPYVEMVSKLCISGVSVGLVPPKHNSIPDPASKQRLMWRNGKSIGLETMRSREVLSYLSLGFCI